MGFWGWRQAAWVAFISVLVVACTDAAPIPPTTPPTRRPVTLTLQGSPGAPPATPRATLVAVTPTPAAADPAPVLEILPPVCHDTASDGYQCLGVVRNLTDTALGTLWLHAELYDSGDIIEQYTFALEQRGLSSAETAPYRFLFARGADGPLILSLAQGFPVDERLTRLDVRDTSGGLDDTAYVVQGTLVNPLDRPVENVRVLVALWAADMLASFRVVEVATLPAGGEQAIAVRWYGIPPDSDYTFTLVADGIRK